MLKLDTKPSLPADIQHVLDTCHSNLLRSLQSFMGQTESLMKSHQRKLDKLAQGADQDDAETEEEEVVEDTEVKSITFEEIVQKQDTFQIPKSFINQWGRVYSGDAKKGDPDMDVMQLRSGIPVFLKHFSDRWQELNTTFLEQTQTSNDTPTFSLIDDKEVERTLSEKNLMPHYANEQQMNLTLIKSALKQAIPEAKVDDASLPFLPQGLANCILYGMEKSQFPESLCAIIKSQIPELLLPKVSILYSSIVLSLKQKGYQLSETTDQIKQAGDDESDDEFDFESATFDDDESSSGFQELLDEDQPLETVEQLVENNKNAVRLDEIIEEIPDDREAVSLTNEQAEKLLSNYQHNAEHTGMSLQDFLSEHLDTDSDSDQYQVLSAKQANFVNLISFLFDFIHQEAGVIPELEFQVMRLQIPFMRLAMIDDRLFQTDKHPARVFLNKLSELVPSLESANEESFKAIKAIIDDIIDSEYVNSPIFKKAVIKLKDVSDEITRALREKEEQARKLAEEEAQQAELALDADIAVKEIVSERIGRLENPLIFHQLLKYVWSLVVHSTYMRYLGLADERTHAVEMFENILWSTGYGYDPLNKRQLLRILPKLVSGIETILEDNELDSIVKEFFLDQLREIHLKVIKNEQVTNIHIKDEDVSNNDKAKEIVSRLYLDSEHKKRVKARQEKEQQKAVIEMGVGHYSKPPEPSKATEKTKEVPKTPAEPGFSSDLDRFLSDEFVADIGAVTPEDRMEPVSAPKRVEPTVDHTVTLLSESQAKKALMMLSPGTWFKYKINNEFKRCKLLLLSPSLRKYTFVDASGQNEFHINRSDLIIDLQQGYAKVLENTDTFDRALEHLIDETRGG